MTLRFPLLLLAFAALVGMANLPMQERPALQSPKKTAVQEAQQMNPVTGKTIRWSFDDGPMAGTTFEHLFHPDGSVTWRIVDWEHQGATATEKSYAGVKINDRTWAISYLAASGHTLTVVLNLDDGQAIGFASNDKSWHVSHGRFEIVN